MVPADWHTSKAVVDKISASLSKAGPSKQPDPTSQTSDPTTRAFDHSDAQPMNVYGPPLLPKFTQSVQSDHASKYSDHQSDHSDPQLGVPLGAQRVCSKAKKHLDKKTHKVQAKYYSQSSSAEEDHSSVPVKKSTKPQ